MGSKRKPFEAGIETLDRDRLLGFIREQLPDADDITLSDIGPGAHGVSRDHFVFDLTWSIGELGYVLQRYQQGTGFEVDESHLLFWEILLMLETVLYFQSLIADGRRHGNEASPLEPLVPRLIDLIEQTLG